LNSEDHFMAKCATLLKYTRLAAELHVACERAQWEGLIRNLQSASPNEACTFVLTRPSRGTIRTTVLLREIIWPQKGEIEATPNSLEISADYISRVLDAAADAGPLTGVALIHTHPRSANGEGAAAFSPRDDWYENRLFPTLTLARRGALCPSLVIGSEPGRVDARVWLDLGTGPQVQRAHAVRIVGPALWILETPTSPWTDHPDPELMDRSTRLWGDQGRRVLQNLRVGVIGAGGTGSIVLICLATMGVGRIRAWDKDTLRKENLHRVLGADRAWLGQPKVICLAEYARLIATASPFAIEPIVDWGTSQEGLLGIKDCDLAFSCVDKLAPRVPLNDLAYAHLIPVIDMGSRIYPAGKRVDALMTHAHVLSPGVPCAWCTGNLTSLRLMREAQGIQRGAENRIPYGLPLEETDGVEPSVLPLNLVGAGLALVEFMQVALRVSPRTPRDLKFFLPAWELDESDLDPLPDCACQSDLALGDAVRIRPVSD
jgi:hypothetical protein